MHAMAAELTNPQVADQLALFAALLDLADTSPFAVRAYSRAAELVRSLPTPVAQLVREGRIRELRGIGPGIESKLLELVTTGEIAELRDLQAELPPELVSYGRLHGLSTKRISSIARALEITTVPELESAVAEGRLRQVPGIGPATEAQIAAALARPPQAQRGLTVNRSRALSHDIAGRSAATSQAPPVASVSSRSSCASSCRPTDRQTRSTPSRHFRRSWRSWSARSDAGSG
jgi:DNA polymerase (family 10)